MKEWQDLLGKDDPQHPARAFGEAVEREAAAEAPRRGAAVLAHEAELRRLAAAKAASEAAKAASEAAKADVELRTAAVEAEGGRPRARAG